MYEINLKNYNEKYYNQSRGGMGTRYGGHLVLIKNGRSEKSNVTYYCFEFSVEKNSLKYSDL